MDEGNLIIEINLDKGGLMKYLMLLQVKDLKNANIEILEIKYYHQKILKVILPRCIQ